MPDVQTFKLPYISDIGRESTTIHGYAEIEGIEGYEGTPLRDKVVFRVDVLAFLKDMFSSNTISSYRNLVYGMISGKTNVKDQISKTIAALYQEDKVFRVYLGEIVHFTNKLESDSLYSIVIREAHEVLEEQRKGLITSLKIEGAKFLFESKCYYYFSIDDYDCTIKLPEGLRGEVISLAKVWRGNFQTSG